MGNLTKGEMVFRVLMGALIVVALLLPVGGDLMLWVLAGVLAATGIAKYCPLCQAVDKK